MKSLELFAESPAHCILLIRINNYVPRMLFCNKTLTYDYFKINILGLNGAICYLNTFSLQNQSQFNCVPIFT